MAKFKNIKKTKRTNSATATIGKQQVKPTSKKKVSKKEVTQVLSVKSSTKYPEKAQEFPKNSRSITENLLRMRLPTISLSPRLWLHTINILALVGLLLVGIGLGRYIEQVEQLQAQKKELATKLTQWEALTQKYPGFRDLYMNIAIVAYEVKDFKKADEYVEKALAIDPNYEPALKLKGAILTQMGK